MPDDKNVKSAGIDVPEQNSIVDIDVPEQKEDTSPQYNDDEYVKFDNLSVGYNGKAIIHDICIDIKKGEIVAMIGPNGAGKSTILKTLTKQLAIIKGEVGFEGRNMHRIPNKELSQKMAVVLTERLKTDLLTCYDVVASGRYPYTGKLGILMPEDERMVDEAIAAVHATELGPRDFNAISDGQRQRIMLARAICQDPELIILDEPTSFLDIKYKLELLSILRNMAKMKGITVITSLHEIDLAMKIADKIICVKGDHIYRYGAPDEIFDEDLIRELYDIDNGFFDPLYGSIELPAPSGNGWERHLKGIVPVQRQNGDGKASDGRGPKGGHPAHEAYVDTPYAFVISSGGGGIPVYRKLQRSNLTFAAGILYENDMDYRLARLLAMEVVTEKPFADISDEAFDKAANLIHKCRRVLYVPFDMGECNARIKDLLKIAEEEGKLETV